ncbi:magnesium transporter [Corynebacterium anserum]|uniref:magnesium transporter n=1 Tax=Corynebacterium anserum TaxID=2684406 RepID=UPI0021AF3165|nr:magnesium transporter [Corynebacterium anserum]
MTAAAAQASLRSLLHSRDVDTARQWLSAETSSSIAEEFSRLTPSEMAIAFRLLTKERALRVFEFIDPPVQADLLHGLREEETGEMFNSLAPDDQAELLDEMPAKVAARLLEGLPNSRRELVDDLLGYPAESAGRLMVPTPTVLSPRVTREEALEKIQRNAENSRHPDMNASHSEIAVIPVTDDTRKLLGTVALSSLVTAPTGTRVEELLHRDKHHAQASEDQEVAARLMQESDMLALPVVDAEERILGLITVDDAMEVLEFEATEDAYRSGGSEPLKEPYLTATVMTLAKKRGIWLIILILAAFLTINVMEIFESTLEAVVVLSVFVPMIIGTGGNAGSQAASSVVRALAVDEVRPSDIFRVIWREVRVGFLLGIFLGALIFPVIFLLYDGRVGATISLSIVAICTWACIVGGVLPLAGRKLGVDPAVFSTPVVSTLVDATGLLIYFPWRE